jgi:CheY-like chemotaxis protein
MKKIVVADDELRIRMLYEEVLSELGTEARPGISIRNMTPIW